MAETGPTLERPRVVVAVTTFRRPELLQRLLVELMPQVSALGPGTRVVVVDNDPAESARATVATWSHDGVEYAAEHRPGIAAARNRALDEASGADALVFIDDDEVPFPGWLEALVSAWQRWGSAAVAGPVGSQFEGDVTPWVRACPHFRRRTLETGTVLPGAATGNLLLDLHQLDALGVRFDDGYGLTGGSDTMLTRTLARAGGEIRWCDEAEAVESVPPERATRRWVLRRQVRTGNDWSRVHLSLATSGPTRLRMRAELALRGVHRLLRGLLQVLLGVVKRDLSRRATGECDVATSLGVLQGVRGHVVAEYLRPAARSCSSPSVPPPSGGGR